MSDLLVVFSIITLDLIMVLFIISISILCCIRHCRKKTPDDYVEQRDVEDPSIGGTTGHREDEGDDRAQSDPFGEGPSQQDPLFVTFFEETMEAKNGEEERRYKAVCDRVLETLRGDTARSIARFEEFSAIFMAEILEKDQLLTDAVFRLAEFSTESLRNASVTIQTTEGVTSQLETLASTMERIQERSVGLETAASGSVKSSIDALEKASAIIQTLGGVASQMERLTSQMEEIQKRSVDLGTVASGSVESSIETIRRASANNQTLADIVFRLGLFFSLMEEMDAKNRAIVDAVNSIEKCIKKESSLEEGTS
jgi:hypothetical protein